MNCGRRYHLHYLKLAFKLTTPSENANFDRFRLIVPRGVRANKKIQLSLIGSRQCAFNWAIDEAYALPLSPPNGGSKREFLHHFALPFTSSLQVVLDTLNLVCGLNIASPSYRWQTAQARIQRYHGRIQKVELGEQEIFHPFPSPCTPLSIPSFSLSSFLEVGPLNPARVSGGAL